MRFFGLPAQAALIVIMLDDFYFHGFSWGNFTLSKLTGCDHIANAIVIITMLIPLPCDKIDPLLL